MTLRPLLALPALALLAGCLSFSSSNPRPPAGNTVLVPAY